MSLSTEPVQSTAKPLPFLPDDIGRSVPERFRCVAARFPERTAVQSGSQAYTYRAFDEATDRIAGAVAAVVREPEQPVALLFSPGEAAPLLAIFGVLKAGGCYVGLHPAFPLERNRAIWTDVQAELLLTDRQHLAQAHHITQGKRPVLVLEELLATPGQLPPSVTISPDQMAAVFYTSGSTGRPKGVGWTHRQILCQAWVNVCNEMRGPHDRIVLSHFVGYGASMLSVFGALLTGAAVCPLDLQLLTVPELLGFLEREAVTVLSPPIALFRQMLSQLTGPVDLPHLRLLELGGDVLLKADVDRFRQYFPPSCVLVHRLAMSEIGIVTQIMLGHTTPLSTQRVPVGYPIDEREVLLWGDDHQPVPPGHVGQIAIRSRYLSPGYWRNPDPPGLFA